MYKDIRKIRQAFTDAIGETAVTTGREASAYGWTGYGQNKDVDLVLKPKNKTQVQSIVRIANDLYGQVEGGLTLATRSIGKNWGYGVASPVADGSIILDLSSMKDIRWQDKISENLGWLTVEPGVTQGELDRFLQEHHPEWMVPALNGSGPETSMIGNALQGGFSMVPPAHRRTAVDGMTVIMANGEMLQTNPVLDPLHSGTSPLHMAQYLGIGGIVTDMTFALPPRPAHFMTIEFDITEDRHFDAALLQTQEILHQHNGHKHHLVGGFVFNNRHRQIAGLRDSEIRNRLENLPQGPLTSSCVEAISTEKKLPAWRGYTRLYTLDARISYEIFRDMFNRLSGVASNFSVAEHPKSSITQIMSMGPFLTKGHGWRTPVLNALELDPATMHSAETRSNLILPYYRRKREGDIPARLDPGQDKCGLRWLAVPLQLDAEILRNFERIIQDTFPAYGFDPVISFVSVDFRFVYALCPMIWDPQDEAMSARSAACYREVFDKRQETCLIYPYRYPYDMGDLQETYYSETIPHHFPWMTKIKKSYDPCHIFETPRPDR